MDENVKSDIGKKLHDKRLEKGLTLDDLQQITKIQKRYLISIEDERFDELPGDFYVRAFVKQYADSVGLDGNELLLEYDDQLPETKTSEYSDHITQAVETRTGKARAVDKVDRLRQYMPTIIVVVVILLILGAIWLTALSGRKSSSSSEIDSSSVSVSGESSKKNSSSASSKSSSKTAKSSSDTSSSLKLTRETQTSSSVTFKTSNTDAYTITITPTARLWASVTGDGSSLYAKTMTANKKQTIKVAKGTSRVVISLGNAASANIKVNGKTLDITNNNKYPNVNSITLSSSSSTTESTSSSAATQSSTTNN